MTELVLVRHGETVYHAENRYAGRGDIALTDAGLADASRLARWASGARLDAVVSSPLSRAVRTAAPSAEAAGLTPTVDERLVEVDFGAVEGLTRAEMRERFPDALAAFLAAPASAPMPGGEAGADAVARALPALHDLAAAWPSGRVLVVAHQTLLRLLLCDLIGVALDRYRTVFPALEPAALTEIRLPAGDGRGSGVALVRLNAPCE